MIPAMLPGSRVKPPPVMTPMISTKPLPRPPAAITVLPSGLLHRTGRNVAEPWSRVTVCSTASRAPEATENSDTVIRALAGWRLTTAVLATILVPSGVIMLSGPAGIMENCLSCVGPKSSTTLVRRRLLPGAAVSSSRTWARCWRPARIGNAIVAPSAVHDSGLALLPTGLRPVMSARPAQRQVRSSRPVPRS